MNTFLEILADVFKGIPYVVAGINVIHAEKSTASKTQIANDVLSVATQGAIALLPTSQANIATTVSAAVATGIASVQAVHDAVKGTTTPQVSSTSTVASLVSGQ